MKLINIKTLSELLSVRPKTIYDWVHRNEIPYYKIGHLVRFEYKEIQDWLNVKKQEASRTVTL
ncbi:MAG: helix-turn-helix domain-containing protein [bacterium]